MILGISLYIYLCKNYDSPTIHKKNMEGFHGRGVSLILEGFYAAELLILMEEWITPEINLEDSS